MSHNLLSNQISWTSMHCEKDHKPCWRDWSGFHIALCIPVPCPGVQVNRTPQILGEHTTHLCTFSMAATSASAARLKNADTAGISGVLLRVCAASVLCEQSSAQPDSVTLGRFLCSCSFGLSSAMKGKFITRGSPCSLQRRDTEDSVRQCKMS